MHRSIFITLLCISLCYTAPQESKTNESPPTTARQIPIKIENKMDAPRNVDTKEGKPVLTNDSLASSSNVSSVKTIASTTNDSTPVIPTITPATSSTNPSTTTEASKNSHETTKSTPASSTEPTQAPTAEPTQAPTAEPTPPDTTTKSTPPPTTTKPTQAPTTEPTTVQPQSSSSPSTSAPIVTTTVTPAKGRTFDGASFLGGMILSFGMVAIGILGFRYYKSHSEQNYHTLWNGKIAHETLQSNLMWVSLCKCTFILYILLSSVLYFYVNVWM